MMLFKLSPLIMLKFLSVGLAFITNVVLIKSIGTSDSGIYYTSLSYLSLAVPLGCMGFNNFILKKTSSGTNVQEVNFSIFLSLFNGFILVFFVSWILSYAYPDYFDYKLSYIVALNVPFLIFAENMSRYQQGLGYHKLSLLTVGIIQQVLMFLYFIFSPLIGFKVELSNVMCAYTVSNFTSLLINLKFYFDRNDIKGLEFSRIKVSEFQESIYFMTISLLSVFSIAAPNLVISQFSSTEEITYYSISYKIATLITIIYVVLNRIISPNIVRNINNKSELQKIVTYVFNFMLFYSLVSATVIIYFSDYILYLISPDLSDAYYILVTLIVSHSIQSCFTITGTVLTLSGNNQVHLKNLVIAIGFFILALLILTNIYGALGAALSYLVFIIIKSCLSTMSLKKCLNVTIAKI